MTTGNTERLNTLCEVKTALERLVIMLLRNVLRLDNGARRREEKCSGKTIASIWSVCMGPAVT